MSRPPVANTSQYTDILLKLNDSTLLNLVRHNCPVSLDDLHCTKHSPADSYVSISANGMEGQFLSIVYAEMWKCEDNSDIQCPSGR